MPISIMLADDHPLVLRGMHSLLESEQDFEVVGEAADGHETLRMVQELKPDVLVLDLMMPGLGGLEVLRRLKDIAPRTRAVILSMYSSISFVVQALQNGAAGYVLKGCSEENLVLAVREAWAGRRFLSPPVAESAISEHLEQAGTGNADRHDTLTPRHREVLQLAAEGKTNAEIAATLGISPRTVENHRATLMHRLGLQNHIDLIRHAIRHGLIPGDK